MLFTPVTREQAKLRMALSGVSGGGKTLGALYIAYGITRDWSRVALIDTERGRGRHYATRTDDHLPYATGTFLYAGFDPPYSPERYIELVSQGAQAVGSDGVVIIDSLSHGWNEEGGVLDIKDQIAKSGRPGINDYTAWNEAGKHQRTLVNALFSSNCHTIVTLRTKMEYTLEMNDRGRQQPVKLGLKPIQRDETEYEFDIVLNIARNHVATCAKDVTFLDSWNEPITPELGRLLIEWLRQGEEPVRCTDCGRLIRNGEKRTALEIIAASTQHAKRPLCLACYGAWHHNQQATADPGVAPESNEPV